jgi:hypothetical protein
LGLGNLSVCRTQKSASWSLPFRIAVEPDFEIKPLDQLVSRLIIIHAVPVAGGVDPLAGEYRSRYGKVNYF